jgi:hypothetical protein
MEVKYSNQTLLLGKFTGKCAWWAFRCDYFLCFTRENFGKSLKGIWFQYLIGKMLFFNKIQNIYYLPVTVFWVICRYYCDSKALKDAFHPTLAIIWAVYQNLKISKLQWNKNELFLKVSAWILMLLVLCWIFHRFSFRFSHQTCKSWSNIRKWCATETYEKGSMIYLLL